MNNYSILQINYENADKIKNLYEDFCQNAIKNYKFELPPLDFSAFKVALNQNYLKAIALIDVNIAVGVLLYTTGINEAVELNVIHLADKKKTKERKELLIKALIEDTQRNEGAKTISYAMLGIQSNFADEIQKLKFSVIEQCNMSVLLPIKTELIAKLPEGYSLKSWDDSYVPQACEVIFEAFQNSTDALYDPRYKSIEGVKDIVHKIVSGMYGEFVPESTTLLIKDEKLEGICFTNLTDNKTANIPLISIKNSSKGKSLGTIILNHSLTKIPVNKLTACVDKTNLPAIKMYKKLGFKEYMAYLHAYINF